MNTKTYYIVFTEVCGIYRPVKQFRKKAWLEKFLLSHPNVSFYRLVGEKLSLDYDVAKGMVVRQIIHY